MFPPFYFFKNMHNIPYFAGLFAFHKYRFVTFYLMHIPILPCSSENTEKSSKRASSLSRGFSSHVFLPI